MKKYRLWFSLITIPCSCAPKIMILQAPVVSMKRTDSGPIKDLKTGSQVQESWCSDENPIEVNDDGSKHYGMIDQVIWKAHRSSKAPFFKDAKFYKQGSCVSMLAIAAFDGKSHIDQDSKKNARPNKKNK